MSNYRWAKLQIFAGEGAPAGEGGAEASGENDAAAGQQERLLKLGVPRDKLPKGRLRTNTGAGAPPALQTQRQTQGTESTDAGKGRGAPSATTASGGDSSPNGGAKEGDNTFDGEPKGAGETPAALDWDAIVKNPDFNNRLQYMMRQRLGEESHAKEILGALTPVLQQIAKDKGIQDLDLSDMSKIDPQNLALRLSHDRDYIRQVAAELGVDEETAADVVHNKDAVAYYKRQERERQLREAFNQHVSGLRAQAEALKEELPELNFDREMQDPRFRKLVGPETRMSVKEAYWALHSDELMRQKTAAAAQQSREQLAAAVQANQQRPRENGAGGQAAPVPGFDPRHMSPAEREALNKRIYEAAYRGEKIYPGG